MKVIKHKDKWYLQSETGYKEILLSTDDLLIKDGVQAIDDEFLEWFVKNPSCENVDIEPLMAGFVDDEPSYYENMYDIIIPKEEPKKVLTEKDIFNQRDIDAVTDYINRETSKQETLLKCLCGEKTICDCQLPKSTITKKVYETHNYLQGFINQFEEGGEHQELSNDDWTVSRFLEWLKHNNFKIIKDVD